jgi:hypothetical protein
MDVHYIKNKKEENHQCLHIPLLVAASMSLRQQKRKALLLW